LTDTQQSLVNAISEVGETHEDAGRFSWQTWEEDDADRDTRRMGRSPDELRTVKELFKSEVGSEISYGSDRPEPLIMKRQSVASGVHSQCRDKEWGEGAIEDVEVMGHVSTGQGSYDGATSSIHTTTCHSFQDDNHHSSSNNSCEDDMDTKVEDWLARGFLSSTSPAVGHSRSPSTETDRAFPSKKPALSLFPPRSPTTGNLEYTPPNSPFARPVCPMSPLGNGRDAYGNYISTNTRDYFTTQSPPTSPNLGPMSGHQNSSTATSLRATPAGKASSTTSRSLPIVHLRGGEWPKPFWKTDSAGPPSQAPHSPPQYRMTNENGMTRDVPAITYTGRPDNRAPPSVRSKFSFLRSERDPRRPERTANDDGRQDAGNRGEYVTISDRRKTHNSSNTDGSSEYKARVDKPLGHYGQHFAPSSPTGLTSVDPRPINHRENETTYGRAEVPGNSKRPIQPISKERPTSYDTTDSWESHSSASTVKSHEIAPRVEKRWNREKPLPPPPPTAPPPPPRQQPPQPLDHRHEDDSSICSDGSDTRRSPSISLSLTEANDPLKDLPDLQTSKAYQNVAHDREVQRIEAQRRRYDEEDQRRREIIMREQQSVQLRDQSTIMPDDSVSEMIMQKRVERLREERFMEPVIEQRRPRTPAPPSLHMPRYVFSPVNVRPTQQTQHQAGYVSRDFAPVPPVQTGRPRKKSLQKVASLAGKVSRFLLAAPSDPELKTYSSRRPLVQKIRQPGMGAERNGWPMPLPLNVGGPMGMPVPPPSMGWRERRRLSQDVSRPNLHEKARNSLTGLRAGNPRTDIFKKESGNKKAVSEPQSPRTEKKYFTPSEIRHADLPIIPVGNTSVNTYYAGPTHPKAAHVGYPRSGSAPQQPQPTTLTPAPEPRYVTPRIPGEPLPYDAHLGYPAHWRMMEFYGHSDRARVTGQWVDRVAHEGRVPLRGGDAAQYGDIDALLMSSSRVGLDEATVEALDGAEANMRSSFSSDSSVVVRTRERLWRGAMSFREGF
jgi:hypothetical protein